MCEGPQRHGVGVNACVEHNQLLFHVHTHLFEGPSVSPPPGQSGGG